MEKAFYSNTLKKSIRISTTTDNAWNMISKIGELQWLDGIKSSKYLSNKKRGVGAIRSISFLDGTVVTNSPCIVNQASQRLRRR